MILRETAETPGSQSKVIQQECVLACTWLAKAELCHLCQVALLKPLLHKYTSPFQPIRKGVLFPWDWTSIWMQSERAWWQLSHACPTAPWGGNTMTISGSISLFVLYFKGWGHLCLLCQHWDVVSMCFLSWADKASSEIKYRSEKCHAK